MALERDWFMNKINDTNDAKNGSLHCHLYSYQAIIHPMGEQKTVCKVLSWINEL